MCCKVSNNLAVYKYNKVFFYRKRLRSVTLGAGYFVTLCDKKQRCTALRNTPYLICMEEMITSESSSYHSSQQHPCKSRSPVALRGCIMCCLL